MKIVSIEPIMLNIPFSDGGTGRGLMPSPWISLDFTLVRIETDTGLIGWGEGFGYFCNEAVAAIIRRSITPILLGCELVDPAVMSDEVQRKMVLQGRYGISTFAQSGVDIALWDLAAKAEQVSVAELIGSRIRNNVPAYASLVRYGDKNMVARYSEQALAQGFSEIKLHEITMPEIKHCRKTIGPDVPMIIDVNCNWSESYCREVIPELITLNTRWLEEPIFPPEDFRQLADLRKTGIPIAIGENACTAVQFEEILRMEASDFLQPSITKVGGISEFNKICKLNNRFQVPMMPHSPYFGPGYLATLQMAAVEERFELFEYLYIEPEDWLYRDMPLPENGRIQIPAGPGLGMDPDPAVIAKYRTV